MFLISICLRPFSRHLHNLLVIFREPRDHYTRLTYLMSVGVGILFATVLVSTYATCLVISSSKNKASASRDTSILVV